MGDVDIKKCSSCGESLEADAAFCTNCGRRIEEKEGQKGGGSPIGAQLLALAGDFLSVREVQPGRFEFSSRTGAQAPAQKVRIEYEAVAQLEPGKNQLTFWEKMTESSTGMKTGFFSEKKIQKGIEVTQETHGRLLSGGEYGFEYGKLREVVKAIAEDRGWKFSLVIFKPSAAKSLSPNGDVSSRNEPKKRTLIPLVLVVIALLIAGGTLAVHLSKGDKAPAAPEKKPAASLNIEKMAKAQEGKPEETAPLPEKAAPVDFNAEGMAKAKEGKIEEAASLFRKAAQADPDNYNAWNNLGLALRKIGKKEEAVRAYQRALEIKPDFALVYKNLGIALEQMDKKKEAADAYLNYAKLNPSAPDAKAAKEKADMLTGTGQRTGRKG